MGWEVGPYLLVRLRFGFQEEEKQRWVHGDCLQEYREDLLSTMYGRSGNNMD